ncbi:MAG: hypothetical protein LBO05_05290 [Deltaproteobacteria bacterium]|nr:hypothetical protein [Deltaproteobacteria bacterium]
MPVVSKGTSRRQTDAPSADRTRTGRPEAPVPDRPSTAPGRPEAGPAAPPAAPGPAGGPFAAETRRRSPDADAALPRVRVEVVCLSLARSPAARGSRRTDAVGLRVLLRSGPDGPEGACWSLPGHDAGPGQSLRETAAGVAAEVLGDKEVFLEQLRTLDSLDFSGPVAPGADGGPRTIFCLHAALVPEDEAEATCASGNHHWVALDLPGGEKTGQGAGKKKPAGAAPTADNDVDGGRTGDEAKADWKRTGGEKRGKESDNGGTAPDGPRLHVDRFRTLSMSADDGPRDIRQASGRDGVRLGGADYLKIKTALRWLHANLDDLDLAFKLMPKKFTITGLKQTYELVQGRAYFDADFRRRMQSRLRPTNQTMAPKPFRPAGLFSHADGSPAKE